jgi:hypothetical protein
MLRSTGGCSRHERTSCLSSGIPERAGGKVLKTNESLERATKAYYESRTVLAALEKPGRF